MAPAIIKAARSRIGYYPELIAWESLFYETCGWSSDYAAKNMHKGYYSKKEASFEEAVQLSESRPDLW